MAIVAGIDFGTLSVRVSIVDSKKGRIGSAVAEYPLTRKKDDPDHATQKPADHLTALVKAMKQALGEAGVTGSAILALAIDTTGSTIVPVDKDLQPLDDYYLWCDHRAKKEAAEITAVAHREKLAAIDWCGGVYSSEWGFAKLLHWLRNNPAKAGQMATAIEHCDLAAATLCGLNDLSQLPRSICAAGHKWMYNEALGGLPPEDFLVKVDPLLKGVRAKLTGRFATSDTIAGRLSPEWAEKLGLKAGIPIPVGAFDAHWDAIGAGLNEGDIVHVVGTSSVLMAIAKQVDLIPGVCGVVKGSVHPDYFGIEAGLAACGEVFEAIARRAGSSVAALSQGLTHYCPGQTGLLRMVWDNGDRTVLVNPHLGGITLGWTIVTSAQDELFAAIEGTAYHTRIILERMGEYGVPINRIINAGGIPRKNPVLNQIYADVFNKPVLVPKEEATSLGAAIFAFLAAGVFPTIEAAQEALCPQYDLIQPRPAANAVYEKLYGLFRPLYFGFGRPEGEAIKVGEVLPELRKLAAAARA
jgi:L-ribulokinase